jgi:hypothetical protein
LKKPDTPFAGIKPWVPIYQLDIRPEKIWNFINTTTLRTSNLANVSHFGCTGTEKVTNP